jgi:1,2-beta-oligoglucan phosphorylase
MTAILDLHGARVTSPSGMALEMTASGSLRRLEHDEILVNLFVGNEVESGPANIYLRRHANAVESTPLLGPHSGTRFYVGASPGALLGFGSWGGIEYSLALVLARNAPAWFWHVHLENTSSQPQEIDLTYAQDLALASYGAVRLNEFYVSQYIDHTPLTHAAQGVVVASRQNLAVNGRHPWALIGSLRAGLSFATDALQFHALASRAGQVPAGLTADLPSRRLQHEHSMVVVRDAPLRLDPKAKAAAGFFGSIVADHPAATSAADLARVGEVLALPEAAPAAIDSQSAATIGFTSGAPHAATLFSSAPLLPALALDAEALRNLFGSARRHEETDEQGQPLSFFHGADCHVVLPAKELRVLRPHGHLLRTGRHLTPDESALTSTAWMAGVFHSMVTQGHVSINRLLSTVHSYLGLFRSHGQRVFVEIGATWQLLHIPSAFEISPDSCRWIYRYDRGHDRGEIQVRAEAGSEPHELTLAIEITAGDPLRFLISHHIALNGDDGSVPGSAQWSRDGSAVRLVAAPGGDVAYRFPSGSFEIAPFPGTEFLQVGGDELLFLDGRSREQPFLCVVTGRARSIGVTIRAKLIAEHSQNPLCVQRGQKLIPTLAMSAPAACSHAEPLARIADIVPWLTHNALVHYLSPRGLEQYSGGGWGTRDVCQGPVEMLLALGRVEPIRDLLLRVFRNQNSDGDWPQWFMFFERDRNIRPGDSHGDIVFWPLLVLAQYLVASGDAGVLDEQVPFFDARSPDAGEKATVWRHVQRALAVIEKRVIPGTVLAAYGHGDWNDSLQPADPAMRERMCSAWTVTLHFQVLNALASALRSIGRTQDAAPLESAAGAVRQDFQRLLLIDGVLTGYALFEDAGGVRYLLHPRDDTTGVHYSALAMIHSILEDLLTPEQARRHLQLIDAHLSAPDGVRLFDRPMRYHGGLQRFFQRAESATYFGREIGLMYMHAHLRYAQALAHVGEADRFFKALCQATPIGIRSIVQSATLRQANCYYSSSDAAFDDRYQASAEYDRVVQGTIPLDGGWRVYSSGAGIALALIVRRFLGLSCEADALIVDSVIPSALDGLRVETSLRDRAIDVQYQIGPAGCGVEDIELNGIPLAFTRRANPHRLGAARVPMPAVLEHLTTGRNVLRIILG